ncbi:pyridoxal phosphate-dependent aminotransferase [Nocardioides limicola]|uniref:pyridoxal phosphate-dependent aminotransferase n=1 Tax=Nocardioides limicola TaxID=2803368 RepID=UPI00193C3283|nr:pyridoxal phosphate-dependent aminotransferase [Nocardioides sp. DJM-14]
MKVSATLAINQELLARRQAGQPVLPMGFGEVGLPVHPRLRHALAEHAGRNGYGPVAGVDELRTAAAGYWARRGLPTDPAQVVAGPGSKALLYAVLLAAEADVALPAPSWVSYAAQATLAGRRVWHVPVEPGQGGAPDPARLAAMLAEASAAGEAPRVLVLTVADNPTGRVVSTATVAAIAALAEAHDLLILSDEIYADLPHDPDTVVPSPAWFAPERTVVTTGLSKSLAVGGWRTGVARFPAGARGEALRDRVLTIASEIWSAAPLPVQHVAADAFAEPVELRQRILASARLHGQVAASAAARLRTVGALLPDPQAGFYVYPDFAELAEPLARRGITDAAGLSRWLVDQHGLGSVPAPEFEGPVDALRVRFTTSMLYGESDTERLASLQADDPLALPWISAQLDRFSEALDDLLGSP